MHTFSFRLQRLRRALEREGTGDREDSLENDEGMDDGVQGNEGIVDASNQRDDATSTMVGSGNQGNEASMGAGDLDDEATSAIMGAVDPDNGVTSAIMDAKDLGNDLTVFSVEEIVDSVRRGVAVVVVVVCVCVGGSGLENGSLWCPS